MTKICNFFYPYDLKKNLIPYFKADVAGTVALDIIYEINEYSLKDENDENNTFL